MPLAGDRKPAPLLVTDFWESMPRFSPDGKWFAYSSNESGSFEVYVRSLEKGVKVRVSTKGGAIPVWRADGRELFYEEAGPMVMASEVQLGNAAAASPPKVLFRSCLAENSGDYLGRPGYDVTKDGRRFIFSCLAEGTHRRALSVAIGWQQSVKWPGARP